MSTEEKQGLKENSLKRWAREGWENLRHGNRSTLATVAIIALIALAVGVYYYVRNANLVFDSQLWKEVDAQGTPETLEKLAKDHPTTWAGRVARLHLARRALHPDGLSQLPVADKEKRAKAIESIEKARKDFTTLLDEVRDVPQLKAECLLQSAVAEEALVGIPKAEGSAEMRGSLDKAIGLYKRLAEDKQLSSSFQADLARKHLDALGNPNEVKNFYAKLNDYTADLARRREDAIKRGMPADDIHMRPFPSLTPPTPPAGENPLPPVFPTPPPVSEPTAPGATKKSP